MDADNRKDKKIDKVMLLTTELSEKHQKLKL